MRGRPRPRLRAGEPGPSRGPFPFSAAENFLRGTIGGAASNGTRRKKQASKEEMGDGGFSPSPFIAEEGQPAPPTITGNDGFPCMSQGLVKSCSCRGSVGKRRRPRPTSRHMSTEAACFWGPRCSVLDPWLHREAKPERTLGPGATIGVLGMGVPRLACLRPTARLSQQAVQPIFVNKAPKTLARGQASRDGQRKTSSGVALSGRLTRSGDIKAGQTSRGSRDVSHDDQHQAGASARSIFVSSLVLRRPAQARSTEASGKGCHIGAT